MRIIFLLTALVGLLLLSITLNAVREGKIFRPLKKRLGGLFFSSTEKYFPSLATQASCTFEQVFYLLQIEANPVNMSLLCFYSAVKANSKLDHKFAKKILSLAWL